MILLSSVMNRRIAVKNLLIIAGGLALMQSCRRKQGEASIILRDIRVSAAQEDQLAELVEALIPETESPGAKTLNLHLFVLKMVDDCHSLEDQHDFMEGLSALQQEEKNAAGFWRRVLLEENNKFAKIVKKRVIQGYLNSEYVMKNKLLYELIPGRYNGAVKVEV